MRAVSAFSFLNPRRVILIALPVFLLLLPLSPAQTPPVAAPAGGQAPAASTTPNSPATPANTSPLSATVDEVSLDLTVRTKHNKAVSDLQPTQLAVTDDGSPVQLSSLRLVAGDSGSQHLVTLVFDRLNPEAAKTARKVAERILGVFPEKGYSFAVLQITGRLRLLQPYTRDRSLVEAALVEATPALAAPASAELTPAEKALIASVHSDALTADSADRAADKLILSALEKSHQMLEGRHSYPSLIALQALVLSDRELTGRKFILYFSGGMDPNSDARDTLRSIVGLANRAGVTISVVEANPLDFQMGSAMAASVASSTLGGGPAGGTSAFGAASGGTNPGAILGNDSVHNVAQFQFGDVETRESPLVRMASGTGGIYFRSSGSKRQLQQLHEDLSSWYQASWTPPIKNYDGQFRAIGIHSPRKDLVIRARSGYFAMPPSDSSGIRPFEMPLLNILAGAALPSDIAFHVGILHLGALADGNSGELAVQVPVSQLEIHEDTSTHISSVHASIVAVLKDSKGAVLERFGEDFPLHETPEMLQDTSGQAITLQRHFSADPGVYTLEAAVMDRIGNKAGAQRTTFTIEPPARSLALSDIALVASVEPTEEDNETFEPMHYGNGRVIPNLATELPENSRSLSLFFLVHPVAGSQSQPALRMQILRNGELLTEMPMELKKVSGSGAAIPYLGTIRGKTIPPGKYEVKALLSQDGSAASSSVSFSVEGTVAAANVPNSPLAGTGSSSSDGKDSGPVFEASSAASLFVVSSPTNPIPPPSDDEIKAMIDGTRQRALAWSDSLQNFLCYEVTNHSVDATGHGDWKHKDTLVEKMSLVNHAESRTTVLFDGDRSSVEPDQLQFMHSAGEFGAMFHIIFDPSAKAVFTWKQSANLDGQPVQVFAFQVARANSSFELDHSNHYLVAGFHGLLYLDPATLSVRSIRLDADDIPPALHIRATSFSVDYSWIPMENHDFLLPVRGAVSLAVSRGRPVLNEFEFREYHRFGSQTRILTNDELKVETGK